MRILAVSLLRLGDVLLAAPCLAALKRKYPNANIEILVNRQALGAARLLDSVDTVHVFERDDLQKSLTAIERPLMEPFYHLEKFLGKLNADRFDIVVNLTHNRLSGWLCGAIAADEYCGLVLDRDGKARFGSNWFRYLNEKADQLGDDIFHFSDIFRYAMNLKNEMPHFQWRISSEDRQSAAAIIEANPRFLLMQPFTSETKKEWATSNWLKMAVSLSAQAVEETFLVLGALNEIERAEKLTQELKAAGVHARTTIASLGTVAALMEKASLLITGDTSIKHLAMPTSVPVLELSLGSSDWRRTGFYRADGYIMQPQVGCAPCPHSTECSERSHLCGESLNGNFVADFAAGILRGDRQRLNTLAQQVVRRIKILRTGFSDSEYWDPVALGGSFSAVDLAQAINKLTMKLILEGEHRQALGAFGTEAVRLKRHIIREFPHLNSLTWQGLVQTAGRQAEQQKAEAERVASRLAHLVSASHSQPVVELKEMRALQNRIGDIGNHLEVRRRLLRSLTEVVEEVI